jgi:hypothetical protein
MNQATAFLEPFNAQALDRGTKASLTGFDLEGALSGV